MGVVPLDRLYQMSREDMPRCVACDCNLIVVHVLIEYGEFSEVRQQYYEAEGLQQLFQETYVTCVFYFLREVGLFYRI